MVKKKSEFKEIGLKEVKIDTERIGFFKEIGLKEVKIDTERIGFSEDFGKVAVLEPKELVEREHKQMYDRKIQQLENQGYRVIYAPLEKPKKISRQRVYDILQKS